MTQPAGASERCLKLVVGITLATAISSTAPRSSGSAWAAALPNTAGAPPPLRLRGLDPARRYTARRGFDEAGEAIECSGEQLMRDGLPLTPDDALAASGNGVHVFRIRQIDMR